MLTAIWAFVLLAEPNPVVVPETLRVDGVVLTILDMAEVPAQQSGLLKEVSAREGMMVEQGALLGRIDDSQARLRRAKAETEWQQAKTAAENDIPLRFARKSLDVAQSEWQRAVDSVQRFPKSVSQTELDRLKLLADKAQLEIEQAEQDFAALQQTRVLREHDRDLAELALDQHRMTSPLTGMVVQWKRHPGEWLEPGTAVVRVIRLNRLRAEGFAPASQLSPAAVGSSVVFQTAAGSGSSSEAWTGELAFVSPEIDPINGQVRFWSEVENPTNRLRPGQIGTLTIQKKSVVLSQTPAPASK